MLVEPTAIICALVTMQRPDDERSSDEEQSPDDEQLPDGEQLPDDEQLSVGTC